MDFGREGGPRRDRGSETNREEGIGRREEYPRAETHRRRPLELSACGAGGSGGRGRLVPVPVHISGMQERKT